MSRSGYTDDMDDLSFGRWRAIIASATRGRRGQAFFKELLVALDSMQDKRLIKDDAIDEDGCMCTLGAAARHKGIDPEDLDVYDHEDLGKRLNIAEQLSQEVMFINDEWGSSSETPEQRWQRMRDWVASQIIATESKGSK